MDRKRILVIDDDETVAILLQVILQRAGYHVCTAGTVLEANQYVYGDDTPALIILDVQMPFLSGGAAAAIFKNNDRTRAIPILYVSGKPEAELKALVGETGAAGYLRKPFTAEQVMGTVQGLLGAP